MKRILIFLWFPKVLEVYQSLVHGGLYLATTTSQSTLICSLWLNTINRFVRPVCFQGYPDTMLYDDLKTEK